MSVLQGYQAAPVVVNVHADMAKIETSPYYKQTALEQHVPGYRTWHEAISFGARPR